MTGNEMRVLKSVVYMLKRICPMTELCVKPQEREYARTEKERDDK